MLNQRRSNWTALAVGWVASAATGSFAFSTAAQQTVAVACSDWAEAVAVDSRERTLVVGTAADNRILEWEDGHAHYGDFGLARLLPDGRADLEFGTNGSVTTDAGDFDSLSAVILTFDGAVAAGTTAQRAGERSGPKDLVVLRVNEAGALEAGFGEGGIARINLGGSVTVASIAHAWLGSVYVTGTIAHDEAPSEGFVVRLNAHGALDASFGDGGLVRFGIEGEAVRFHGVRAVWDGLVVGGHATVEGRVGAIALRLDARGRTLVEYGNAGVARYDLTGSVANDGAAAVSRRGSVVVSLSITGRDGAAHVVGVRFDLGGQLVPSADGDVSVLDVPAGTQDSVYAAALRGRSLVLAGGTSPEDFATGDAYVSQLTPSGALDPTFGGGVQSLHLDLEYTSFLGLAVRHGAVTVAGYNFGEMPETLPPSDALVVRYRPDGVLDEGFGDGGVVLVDYRQGAHVCGPRVDVSVTEDGSQAD